MFDISLDWYLPFLGFLSAPGNMMGNHLKSGLVRPIVATNALLLEDGLADELLLESGFSILMEP